MSLDSIVETFCQQMDFDLDVACGVPLHPSSKKHGGEPTHYVRVLHASCYGMEDGSVVPACEGYVAWVDVHILEPSPTKCNKCEYSGESILDFIEILERI